MRLVNTRTRSVIVADLMIANTCLKRLTGYLPFRTPRKGHGILFVKTRRVHTLGMSFPLDIFYLSSNMTILDIKRNVSPFRFPFSPRQTEHIIEVPYFVVGKTDELIVSDKLTLEIAG